MTNRKLLYGYKIQAGDLSVVMEEAVIVSRVFTLYMAGTVIQSSLTVRGFRPSRR